MPYAPARPRFRAALALAALSLAFASVGAAQSATLLRLRSPASADRLVVDSAGGMLVGGAYGQGAIPASGAGTRLMWYPGKAAFRAGFAEATEWNDASVGHFSSALGSNTTASGWYSTAMGLATTASGHYSTAIGMITTASGNYSTAMGMYTTASGTYSTAMGRYASTNGHSGSFAYGDGSTSTVFNATAPHQFAVRASGGVRLFTSSDLGSGVILAAGGSSWLTVSDRNRKERFLAVDGEDVLARIRTLPVSTWRYIAEEDREVRHIGPMAQDWKAAFGFSADSTTINSGDFDGVNLAAAQALEARTRAQAEQIRALQAENTALREEAAATRARLARIEALLEARP